MYLASWDLLIAIDSALIPDTEHLMSTWAKIINVASFSGQQSCLSYGTALNDLVTSCDGCMDAFDMPRRIAWWYQIVYMLKNG
jgi:hypothetical protein